MIPSWREFTQIVRFAIYSFLTLGSLVTGWIAFGLPQVASQAYVDNKFNPIQSQIVPIRLQLNRMTRQALEVEKWRLTNDAKTNNSFEIQSRLRDIELELADTHRERDNLLK